MQFAFKHLHIAHIIITIVTTTITTTITNII